MAVEPRRPAKRRHQGGVAPHGQAAQLVPRSLAGATGAALAHALKKGGWEFVQYLVEDVDARNDYSR